MPFEDVASSSLIRKAIEAAAHGRETLEKGVSQALRAANLPSRQDVASLRKKLEELEAMIDGLAERVDRDRDRGEG